MKDAITILARTNTRGRYYPFGIGQSDRLSHVYLIGKTGVGKTTLIETMIVQDILAGRGCALIDPHGDLVERAAARVPEGRKGDVVYLNVPDPAQPYSYNPLSRVSADKQPLVASGLMEVFKKMWGDAWGVRMEHILRNALLTLLEQPQAKVPDILRLFADKEYRREAVTRVTNEQVRQFWKTEFEKYNFRQVPETLAPIQNKVGAFLSDPRIHRILTGSGTPIRLRSIMDKGQVLLVNLAKGKIGDDSSGLLGGLFVTALGLAAYSRADIQEEERRPFFIYIDEFQNFTTLSIANMLSELRKFRVGMVLAHQYLAQLDPDIRHAVLGNAGTLISFRVGPEDATLLAREFEPTFAPHDLMKLPNHDIYLKLMIDGMPSKPFSATTLPAQ
ncbi:type IV secretion system DNA-binding domain-containing protein [Rhodomicrobium vannielii ATCC 17100]|uniref:type IV secretion system DNA-binding domain-containing protein n=1 Tax=Rhodomicrobium vannielii TaxID=1069 RepID=UPI00191A7927|nr:type IV secretion system DNA-binding domain-containing protein [Rhodomicrobium vannielii ATCC 17100]